jgi:hypothetical protein
MSGISDSPRRRKQKKPFSFVHCRLREIERAFPLLDVDQMRRLLPEIAYTIWVKLTHRGGPIMDDELPNRIQAWFEARCAAICGLRQHVYRLSTLGAVLFEPVPIRKPLSRPQSVAGGSEADRG